MVDIISKKDGPRKEDVHLKKMLRENQGTIRNLADQLTQGNFSAQQRAKQVNQKPQQESGTKYFILSSKDNSGPPEPYIRISINGRVVIVDDRTSKQMHHLGEIRAAKEGKKFLLATAENKFFSPADKDLTDMLHECDGLEINGDFTEEMLSKKIAEILGI